MSHDYLLLCSSSSDMQVYRSRIGDSILPLGYYLDAAQPLTIGKQAPQQLDVHTTRLQGFTFFEAAQSDKCFPILATFLLSGIDPNVPQTDAIGAAALHLAAHGGNILGINFLLDNGADINCRTRGGQTPLMWAIRKGQLDAIQLLLRRGADPALQDSDGSSVVSFACEMPIVLHSLRNAVDLSAAAKREQLLHRLCKSPGTRFAALYCIEQLGCDVNQRDLAARAPLHFAAATGDIDLVKALCSKGADLNVVDERGQRPHTQSGVTREVRSFLTKYEAESSNTGKERLAMPDFSNLARIDIAQVKHFSVAFTVPNLIMVIGSQLPTFVGFLALFACAIGFTMVAQFGMKQRGRSMATAGWFSGALFFGGSVLVRYVLPSYSMERPETLLPLAWWLVTTLMFYCYARAVLADPGVVQSTPDIRRWIYDVIGVGGEAEIHAQSIDHTGMVKKPLRAKHCTKTGQTVYRFDHYCVWTGNAIGGGNHRYFVLYCLFQFFSQAIVAYTTVVYLFIDGPHRAGLEGGVFSWQQTQFLYNSSDNRLVTFYLVFYNSFVFFFVSTVLVTQFWYAMRNVTSNEVWFVDRYKWMFKLGRRAYCMFDQGPKKNLIEFFWSGDLCADIFQVPPMNEYLRKECQRFAAREKSKQLSMQQRNGGGAFDANVTDPVAASAEDPQQCATQQQFGGFDYASAVAQLPTDVQNEMQIVQGMLHKMIGQGSPDNIEVPPGVAPDRREHVLHQAKTMYNHFQAALQMNRQTQETTVPLLAGSDLTGAATSDSNRAGPRKAD